MNQTKTQTTKGPSASQNRARVLNIILPRVLSMVSGVWRIQKSHDLVTIEYTGGQRKSAIIKPDRWKAIGNDSMSVIHEVQKYGNEETRQ